MVNKMEKHSKIYIAGHRGLVGSAVFRNLKSLGFDNFIFTPSQDYDLRNQKEVEAFFEREKPEYVFLAAAKVGGIVANTTYRAEFIYDNLMIQTNIIHQSYVWGVKKLLFLGSSCIYPKSCPQPMREDALLTDILEYTNEPYALSKIAGIKTIESYNLQYGTNFIAVMPTNLYGRNDNFDLEKSHVLPALLRKLHLGKALKNNDFGAIKIDFNRNPVEGINGNASKQEIVDVLNKYGITEQSVKLWGSGNPRREFLHADDLADACVFLMQNVDFKDILSRDFNVINPVFPLTKPEIRNTHINIGTGVDLSIGELAGFIQKDVVKYKGEVIWDSEKPDGTFQKLLDVSKLKSFGWNEKIDLKDGISEVYTEYCNEIS
jgi:GDP-L-fucose synthase